MKRRVFLRAAGASAGSLLLGPRGRARAQAGLPPPDDPGFWQAVRAQFQLPADFVYLNTAGLGSSPAAVTNRVKAEMDREEANPAPGHSEEDWTRIRRKCAALLGPSCRADEVALVSTATEGINAILNTVPFSRGDEVVTSTHEHAGLVIPLLHKAQTHGIVIRTFEPDLESAQGNVDRVVALITPRTRLIFVSHVTCTTGQLMPVAEIARVSARRDVPLALDGAQSWAQLPFDLGTLGAHFFAASGHKWLLGPKRTGVLWIRHDRVASAVPTTVGAYSDAESSLGERRLVLRPNAQRFEYATQNDALIYGVEAAADYLQTITPGRAWAHNRALAERCAAGLAGLRSVELLSPREPAWRTAIIAFRMAGRDNRQVAAELIRRRFRVRSVTEAGLDAVRASFHVYNSDRDVDRLVLAVQELSGTGAVKGRP
jgi:selenocysteine lyase/cysteine desulfurase